LKNGKFSISSTPHTSLQRLVESYRIQTTLTHPSADTAQFLSINELRFRRDSNLLEIGSFYRIRGSFQGQSGRSVEVGPIRPDRGYLWLDSPIWVTIPVRTAIDVIISAKDGFMGQRLSLVDIAVSQ